MILFRVDGNETIGLGHMMRCLSVADALKKHGTEVMFVTADDKCAALLDRRGYPHITLNTDFSEMDGETDRLLELIAGYHPKAVLVDSYFVTESYLRRVKSAARLIYMDDLAAFAYPADVLINYNIFADPEAYQQLYSDKTCPSMLLGTAYTPLRAEFSTVLPHAQPDTAYRVLVSTGGADSLHIALQLVRYLSEHADTFCSYRFTLIVGASNQDIEAIRSIADELPFVSIASDVQNMSEVMLQHDMAISAAGSTLYELCACAIPTVTYILADNQGPAAKVFDDKGIMINVGDVRTLPRFIETTLQTVLSLSVNKEKRTRMCEASRQVTDGKGADRLASAVLRLSD